MDGVLPVRHRDALLELDAGERVPPDRQPQLQRELHEVLGAVGSVGAGDLVFVAQPEGIAAADAHPFQQVIQHHDASERRPQRGDEQTVVAAGDDTGDGA